MWLQTLLIIPNKHIWIRWHDNLSAAYKTHIKTGENQPKKENNDEAKPPICTCWLEYNPMVNPTWKNAERNIEANDQNKIKHIYRFKSHFTKQCLRKSTVDAKAHFISCCKTQIHIHIHNTTNDNKNSPTKQNPKPKPKKKKTKNTQTLPKNGNGKSESRINLFWKSTKHYTMQSTWPELSFHNFSQKYAFCKVIDDDVVQTATFTTFNKVIKCVCTKFPIQDLIIVHNR